MATVIMFVLVYIVAFVYSMAERSIFKFIAVDAHDKHSSLHT